jgi:hypothetical protein
MTGKITFELFGDGNRILHLEHTEVQYRDHIWYVEYRP